MIVIERRFNENEFERIAVYQDGELTGDDDFVESFGYLFEGEVDESTILQRFSGPNLRASVHDERDGNDPESETADQERVERPDEDAGAAEIARWMEEDFGAALAEGMKQADPDAEQNE
jgi:hypothetical protein